MSQTLRNLNLDYSDLSETANSILCNCVFETIEDFSKIIIDLSKSATDVKDFIQKFLNIILSNFYENYIQYELMNYRELDFDETSFVMFSETGSHVNIEEVYNLLLKSLLNLTEGEIF